MALSSACHTTDTQSPAAAARSWLSPPPVTPPTHSPTTNTPQKEKVP